MSDASTVLPHLERWFKSHRVVFWHDPDGQYAADLDGLDLAECGRFALPTTSSASRTGCCTTSRRASSSCTARASADGHR